MKIVKVEKPCPFCGSIEVRVTDAKTYKENKNGCVCISCEGCSTDV